MEVIAVKQWVLGMRIQFLAMPRPDLRIVELLNRLADLYGVEDSDGIRIGTPLTHEQVAALTGTSRVTVTRTVTKLKSEGVIRNVGRHFWMRDPAQGSAREMRYVA
jgi:CRP/FNR family cyclic AMP-dependent transcriptional regulator